MSACGRVSLKERFTRIEFVVVIFVVTISLLIFGTALPRAWSLKQRQNCQENLKTIGEALRMYVDESIDGRFPLPKTRDCTGEIQPWSGAMDMASVFPEYMSDLDIMVCPSYPAGKTALEVWDKGDTTNPRWKPATGFSNNGVVEPCEILAKPYYYYGWAFSEATFEAVTRYEKPHPEDDRSSSFKDRGVPVSVVFDYITHNVRFKTAVASLTVKQQKGAIDIASKDWDLEYASGNPLELPMGSRIPLLRESAEIFYIRDIGFTPDYALKEKARIVVLHEERFPEPELFYHAGRVNILYMDGHVENREWQSSYSAPFPLNEAGAILHDAVEGTLTVPISATAEAASE